MCTTTSSARAVSLWPLTSSNIAAHLRLRRITPKFGRLANVAMVASVDDSYIFHFDLTATVRQIVRKETERHNKSVNAKQLGCDYSAHNRSHEPASAVSSLSAMSGVADRRVDQQRQHRRSFPGDTTPDQRALRDTTTNRLIPVAIYI